MSRRQRRDEKFERHVGNPDWPATSAPRILPEVNLYFTRVSMDGEVDSPGLCHNFAKRWQCGVFLRQVLEGAEEIEHGPLPELAGQEDPREGSSLSYLIVTARDENGTATRGRRFTGRIVGVTFEDAMRLSKAHPDVTLPANEEEWIRTARSLRLSSAPPLETEQPEKKRSREPREPRPERTPRPSRDGLRSLTEICAEEKIAPGDVRAVLRGMKVEKPASGWAWPPNEVPAYVAEAIKKARAKK